MSLFRNRYRIFFIVPVLFTATITACNNKAHTTSVQEYEKPAPPPLTLNIDVEKTCSDLKRMKADSTYNGTVYLIYDSVNMYDRILLEYLLHTEYSLIMRRAISELDTTCLRPFYDAVIESKYHKSRAQIMAGINKKVSVLRNEIGKNKVKKDVYYTADTHPTYPNGMTNLYFAINSLKDSLGSNVHDTGRVMFYFTIDTTGVVSDVEIYQHVSKRADSISSVIMRNLPNKWMPATLDDKKVNYWMQYAIEWP